jgi:flagellar hook-associated protein 1 FlgK
MTGSFGGPSTALSALYAQRRAIEVAGHNVANANTDGYRRQRVDPQAKAGPVTPAMFARGTGGGDGVTVAGVTRIRDESLQTVYAAVEGLFGEPGDGGLQASLAAFWAGWDDVANAPDSPAARAQLLERGRLVTGRLAAADDALFGMWRSATDRARALVEEINATAASVAGHNNAIKSGSTTGWSRTTCSTSATSSWCGSASSPARPPAPARPAWSTSTSAAVLWSRVCTPNS